MALQDGRRTAQTVYDAAAVAKGVAVVTVSGHGTIVKPADSQLAARVRDDGRPSCGANTTAGSPSCGASGCKECWPSCRRPASIRSGSRSPRRPMLRRELFAVLGC